MVVLFEEKAKEILRMALIENHEQPLNLANMIEQQFCEFGRLLITRNS